MKPKLLFLLLTMCGLFTALNAQETNTYFFKGNVYTPNPKGMEKRYPYLPVYLSRVESPDEIIAVGMTNAVGEISFKGVPIDIHKGYIFTLDFGKEQVKYKFFGFKKPSFKGGNVSSHMKVEEDYPEYRKENIMKPSKADDAMRIDQWILMKNPALELEGSTFILKKDELAMRVYMSGQMAHADKLAKVLSEATIDRVSEIVVNTFLSPNEYFGGSVDVRLKDFDLPKITETTFSIPKLK